VLKMNNHRHWEVEVRTIRTATLHHSCYRLGVSPMRAKWDSKLVSCEIEPSRLDRDGARKRSMPGGQTGCKFMTWLARCVKISPT